VGDGGQEVLEQKLGANADRDHAFVRTRRGPLADVDTLGLSPDVERGAIESQGSGAADAIVQIAGDLKVELHQSVAEHDFVSGARVGELGNYDVKILSDAHQFPIALPLLGSQRDAGTDEISRDVAQEARDLGGSLEV